MPAYTFQCPKCDQAYDVFFRLKDHKPSILDWCPRHGHQNFSQVFGRHNVDDWGNGKFFEHLSARGETFYSRRAFKQYLRLHGLREKNSYVD
jgi:putative FmdB family regulatory protein